MICQVMSTDCDIVYNRDMTETRLERALRQQLAFGPIARLEYF